MPKIPNLKKTAAVSSTAAILIATPLIANWEGLRTTPYKDIGGVWTVCYGETHNIEHREYTEQECFDMLKQRVPDYYQYAMQQVEVEIPVTMQAAVTSFTYNVGPEAFRKSTMLKKINRRDFWGACAELDRWVYVAKMWVKGLANRREAEKRLCVAELQAET
ncbi:MAG: lysozyme [Candidatus Puniceispirillaceae bacterium]